MVWHKIEKGKGEVWKNYKIKYLDTNSVLYEAAEFNILNRMIKG